MSPPFADYRAHLAHVRAAALRAVDPAAAVRRALAPSDFAEAERVFVVGAGKAGAAMAQAAAEILGDRLTAGLLSVPAVPPQSPARITFVEGGHPTPTPGSLAAGRALADLLAQTRVRARDLVIALISGGGSALLELPAAGLTLDQLQITNNLLLKSGATIAEVNTVRTQLSQIKGGGLARLAHPARVLALILSDVVGNPLHIIASGPTVPAVAARQDALAVVEKYQLTAHLPSAVLHHLTTPAFPPSSLSPYPSIENRLIASNRLAGEAAASAARELGFEAVFAGDDWQGEAREAGGNFAALVVQKAREQGSSPLASPLRCASGDASRPEGRSRSLGVLREGAGGQPLCVVAGGETTVTVRGSGKGGRNQEAALAAALVIDGMPNIVISTFATDGVDGPTEAAGAVVTGATISRARALGLDPQKYLEGNDAYSFFAVLGALILTGPTGTNVNDLMFGLAY